MNENSRISGLGWTCESSPDVSLSMARERRDAVRRLVADGKDPSAERQTEKKELRLTARRLSSRS